MSNEGRDDPILPQAHDPLIELVRREAADLRNSGLVPADLEARLDAHADAIAARPQRSSARIRKVADSIRVPPSMALRNPASRFIARPVLLVLDRLEQLARSTRQAFEVVADTLDEPDSHSHAALERQVDHLLDRVASLDRLPEGGSALIDLRRRVEALETEVRLLRENPKT